MTVAKPMHIRTFGFGGDDRLTFYPGPGRGCGQTDLVTFAHNSDGAWGVRFEDLERMYVAAKSERQRLAALREPRDATGGGSE